MIGCLWYSASLYSPVIWRSGNAMGVLGGTGLLVGGNMYGATGAQNDVSWGAHLFTGWFVSTATGWLGSCGCLIAFAPCSFYLASAAGVMITVGWGRVSTNFNLVRINGGQFSVGYVSAFWQTPTEAVVVHYRLIVDGQSMYEQSALRTQIHHTTLCITRRTGAFIQIGLTQARAWGPAGIFGKPVCLLIIACATCSTLQDGMISTGWD